MNRHALVGNDVVDINLAETKGTWKNKRFLSRVFTDEERDLISGADDADQMIWLLWSAKETAYKIIKKQSPTTAFAHARFQVDYAGGVVRYGGERIYVNWLTHPGYIHCVGVNQNPCRNQAVLKSEIGECSDSSDESASVRELAKALLHENGILDVEIVRNRAGRGLGPPMIYQNNKRLVSCDISLSHHGRWVAATMIDCRASLSSTTYLLTHYKHDAARFGWPAGWETAGRL